MAHLRKKPRLRFRRGTTPRPRPRVHGFTLVEMIAVIIVTGIIFSLGSVLLGKVFSGYSLKRDATSADWQAKVALERAARELRAARSATATDLDIASATQIRFVDTDGNGVCLYRDTATNRIMRSDDGPSSACGTTGPQPLADNVTALIFSYWDSTAASTAVVASTYYITVGITVVDGSYNASFRTSVWPRSF